MRKKTGNVKTSLVLILLLVLVGVWWFSFRGQRPALNPNAKPRIVTARGDLAQDERSTLTPNAIFNTLLD